MKWFKWKWWRLAWAGWPADRTVRVWDNDGRWRRVAPGLFVLASRGAIVLFALTLAGCPAPKCGQLPPFVVNAPPCDAGPQ